MSAVVNVAETVLVFLAGHFAWVVIIGALLGGLIKLLKLLGLPKYWENILLTIDISFVIAIALLSALKGHLDAQWRAKMENQSAQMQQHADELEAKASRQAKLISDQQDEISQQQKAVAADQNRISEQQDTIATQQLQIAIQQTDLLTLRQNTDPLLGLPCDEMFSDTETNRVLVRSTILHRDRTTSWFWQDLADERADIRAVHQIFFKLVNTPVKNNIHGFVQFYEDPNVGIFSIPSAFIRALFKFGSPQEGVPLVGIQATQNVAYVTFGGWTSVRKRYFISYIKNPQETNLIRQISIVGTNIFLDEKAFN